MSVDTSVAVASLEVGFSMAAVCVRSRGIPAGAPSTGGDEGCNLPEKGWLPSTHRAQSAAFRRARSSAAESAISASEPRRPEAFLVAGYSGQIFACVIGREKCEKLVLRR